jgi:hypothetical protein
MEWLIALGLGIAAGTNAYIPLILLGALARWTPLITLPEGWQWLESQWTLGLLAVLIVLEMVAQRFPGVATVSDVFQTALRPTAAGIAVSAQGASVATITDWDVFWADGQWVPVALAVGVALAVHLAKVVVRATADTVTAGLAGGVLAGIDEGSSVAFSITALLLPVFVPLLLAAVVVGLWWLIRRRKRRISEDTPENN